MALIDAPREALQSGGDSAGSELIRLAQSRSVDDRLVAAAHPATPMGSLIALASDSKDRVREALASNPATGDLPSLLALLSEDSADVQVALVRNPHVPVDVVRAMAPRAKRAVRKAIEARLGQ